MNGPNVNTNPNDVQAHDAPNENAAEAPVPPEAEAASDAPQEAADDAPGDSDIEALQTRIQELEAERDALNNKLLRKQADFQNFRRRMEREKDRLFRAGKKEVVLPMLGILDDFQRSVEAAKQLEETQDAESAYDSLKSGVELVFRKFTDELTGLGVEPIEAEGEPFDENKHEAMMQRPAEGVEEGIVIDEIRKGYRMGDHVLRHSRVIVSA